jgi:hypothetical protein
VILRLKESCYPFSLMKNRNDCCRARLPGAGFSNFLPLPPPKGKAPQSFIPAW